MPWVKVSCFDRDVKVGDKISSKDEMYGGTTGVVTAIGDSSILIKDHEFIGEFQYTKEGWRVWRETKRWRAGNGDMFWKYDDVGHVTTCEDLFNDYSKLRFESGNYFRTQEQAQEYADECKKVAKRLHERWGE